MPDTMIPVGAALSYLQRKFAGQFTELESSPVVANVAASLVGNNPDRLGLFVMNLSANTIELALAGNPSATKGISIAANGGSMSLSVDEDFTLVTREFFAVAPAGNSQVYILEMVRPIADAPQGGK